MSARVKAVWEMLLLPLALVALAAEAGHCFPLRSLAAGEKSPPFTLKTAAGAPWSSAALAGKAAVVCYYRRGQRFSQSALESLAGLASRFEKHGVAFVAVRAAEDSAEPLAAEKDARLAMLVDPGRELYGKWGLFILPTTVVLDKDRRVRDAFASDAGDLADKVGTALEEALGLPRAQPVRKATAPAADSPPPAVGLASRLLADRKPKEALALLKPLLAAPESGCELRLTAARAYLALKQPAPAKAQAEACVAKEPASTGAALALGRASAALGDEQAAEDWLKKASAGGGAEAQYRLGGVYERTGRKDEALSRYRAALQRLLGD